MEPSYKAIAEAAAQAADGIDKGALLVESCKAAGTAADPVPKQLGFASIALSLPKTYMGTDGSAEFAYEVGKDVGIGYIAEVTGAAAAAAAEGSALGPWGAAGSGFAVGLITAVGLDESFKQAERAVVAGLGAASEELAIAYGQLDREITNLYMRYSLQSKQPTEFDGLMKVISVSK